jgi:hypothetical protein
MTDAYDKLRKDWCDAGDMPRATCHHCGARPGGPSLPPLDRPWSFDGQKMTRRGRTGRDIFPEHPAGPAPTRRLLSAEKLPKATCRYDADLGWVTREHLRDCTNITCLGCKPCGDDHCGLRGCAHHVNHSADLWTCPSCIGNTRADLAHIEQLYALVDTDVDLRAGQTAYLSLLLDQATESGAGSEAFNLIGPAAAPEQYSEKRNRLRALYERRGWCDWPRHDGFLENDTHHPYAVLGRWDLELRERYGPYTDLFTTVTSAAAFLRKLLEGPFPHQDLFEQFAAEVRRCREHLEQVTQNDRKPEQGRHCPRCIEANGRGPRLQKRYAVHPGLPPGMRCGAKDLSQGRTMDCRICDGDNDTWHCIDNPDHWWTERDYRERVATDYVEHATELPAAELADRVGVPLSTIRKWAAREWDKAAKVWHEPLLVSRRRGADGRKLYPVAQALALAERRGA